MAFQCGPDRDVLRQPWPERSSNPCLLWSMLVICARLESACNLGAHTTRPCCASRDRMPPREDDDLSLLRALADDLILDVAEQDPARVIKVLVEVCARLAAERHISPQELQTAVEVLLLEWHEQSSGRPTGLSEQADRACTENSHALVGRKVTLSALGELGPLMKVSETFGDALRVLETYRRLQSSGAVLQFAKDGDQAVLSYLPYQGQAGSGLIAECALASLTHVLRHLGGPDWALTEALIPRRAPADQSPYRSFFRSCVRFDQEAAALILPAKLLSMRLVGSDTEVRRVLK